MTGHAAVGLCQFFIGFRAGDEGEAHHDAVLERGVGEVL